MKASASAFTYNWLWSFVLMSVRLSCQLQITQPGCKNNTVTKQNRISYWKLGWQRQETDVPDCKAWVCQDTHWWDVHQLHNGSAPFSISHYRFSQHLISEQNCHQWRWNRHTGTGKWQILRWISLFQKIAPFKPQMYSVVFLVNYTI